MIFSRNVTFHTISTLFNIDFNFVYFLLVVKAFKLGFASKKENMSSQFFPSFHYWWLAWQNFSLDRLIKRKNDFPKSVLFEWTKVMPFFTAKVFWQTFFELSGMMRFRISWQISYANKSNNSHVWLMKPRRTCVYFKNIFFYLILCVFLFFVKTYWNWIPSKNQSNLWIITYYVV